MKKNYGLALIRVIIVTFLFSGISFNLSSCQAVQWERVVSMNEVDYDIDVSSVQRVNFKFGGDNIVCWVKSTTFDKKYGILKFAFREKNGSKQYVILSGIGYDEDGNVTGTVPTIIEPFDFHYRIINHGNRYEALYDKALECVNK